MHAAPIIPRRLYHVTGNGYDIHVIAPSGCAAICRLLEGSLPC